MKMHVCITGQMYSFRENDAGMDERCAIFNGFRYGDALISYGIQGEGYFKGFREHYLEVFKNTYCIMGYIWERHFPIYKRLFRGVAQLDELWRGRPYGVDNPVFIWAILRRLDENGEIIGPKAVWDTAGVQ